MYDTSIDPSKNDLDPSLRYYNIMDIFKSEEEYEEPPCSPSPKIDEDSDSDSDSDEEEDIDGPPSYSQCVKMAAELDEIVSKCSTRSLLKSKMVDRQAAKRVNLNSTKTTEAQKLVLYRLYAQDRKKRAPAAPRRARTLPRSLPSMTQVYYDIQADTNMPFEIRSDAIRRMAESVRVIIQRILNEPKDNKENIRDF